ncbi:hypothetical protein EMGBS15_10390 [Filimonas sp.]|nr:hypothetical protein EMGBS15_10390 [Filimonas sp.]
MLTLRNLISTGLILVLFVQNTLAQETTEKKKEPLQVNHQIGINIASFADRFLKFNNATNLLTDPYLFAYRLQLGDHSVIRLGVGVSMTNEKLTSSTSSEPRSNKASSTDIRLGYEYYLLNLSRWKAGAGINAFYSRSYSKSVQENDPSFSSFIQTASSNAVGAAISLSVQYMVMKRVSIGTEGGLYYKKEKIKDKTEITGQFPSVSSSASTLDKIASQLPVSLFLNFNF